MKRPTIALIILAALMWPCGAANLASVALQVDRPTARVSSNLFGIFFEEINYGGEGGLYAELVRNRTFANSANPDFWTLVTSGTAAGTMTVGTFQPLNTNNLRSLNLAMASGLGSVGAANTGYWGIALQAGATYDLSFYARGSNGFSGPVNVRLEGGDGTQLYAQAAFSGLTPNWQKFSAPLVSSTTATNARLVLSLTNLASIGLDDVSLFPRATFHGRTNGMRSDLADMLAGLQPSFFRFPGGCYVEGDLLANAFSWKRSVGDPAARPGHWNGVWNYFSTDGLGFHEYLQLCEDLGAEPLFGINCGMSHTETVALADMGPYVQDALDAIEYANGGTNTVWGALRAANGHPSPFNLKFMEIGNENGGTSYDDRYALFYDAIKAVHPDINLIACVWGGTPSSRPFDLMDEHYYTSPATMASYATKYDNYNRKGPKVFVGEYAVTSGFGTYGNLAAALGEAAFMTGLERNSDVVKLACYAPLFANVNGMQWHPNLINYDNARSFGTPAYYVQKMFSQNRGDMVLPTVVSAVGVVSNPPPRGAVGVGSWATSVQYTNIVVTSNGVTLYASDFVNQGTNAWRVYNGTWGVSAGRYQQTSTSATDCRSTTGNTNWSNYTLSLRARRTGGSEGLLVLFNWLDDNNWTWLNLGGWGNTQHAIEQSVNGSKSTLGTPVAGTLNNNQWYDISIVLTGPRIQCYLNGTLIQDVSYLTTSPSGLFASSTYDESSGQVIIKAVNPYASPLETSFALTGVDAVSPSAALTQLTAASSLDENTFATPTKVTPVVSMISNAGTNFTLTIPGNSLSVLRLQAAGTHFITNLTVQVPSPISGSQTVVPTVWGQISGGTNWINLTGVTNYGVRIASGNSQILGVDALGNVTGIASGTANIIASYPALGLSATQAVQVVGTPTALVHRYSFNESGGNTVADSVGGPAWNGTLPNGGTLGGGRLTLAASAQQHVQLPAGILSNYAIVTLDSWVTFPTQLPVNCFYFGFGNSSGGYGSSYLFSAPRAGRIAITSGDWTGEQNAIGAGDLSFRTNLHLTAIFAPPAGSITLYTNGVLAGCNTNVTVSLGSVNDVYGYIGKSLYSGDPYPDLILDEFRIYNGAVSASEIASAQALGPGKLLSTAGVNLNAAPGTSNLAVAWPVAAGGFTLESRSNLASGFWEPVSPPPQIVGEEWRVAVPISGAEQYFRLRR